MIYKANGKELKEFSGAVLETIVGEAGISSAGIAEALGVSPKRVPGALGALKKAGYITSAKVDKVNVYSPVESLEFEVTEPEEPEESEEE